MAGHSKWANIQHRKGRQDAKRAKIFTKIVREITVAARLGGADPDANPRLRAAVAAAKSVSMPGDNIQRAIDKGTGAGNDAAYDEFVYEGYGPHGVAVMVEGFTDNRNRTAAELRNLFDRSGGNLAENGSVAWQFSRKGYLSATPGDLDAESFVELMIESGAEDFTEEGESWDVFTPVEDLHVVAQAFEEAGVEVAEVEPVMMPSNEIELSESEAKKISGMIESLEDHDDIQKVWTNADFSNLDESEDE